MNQYLNSFHAVGTGLHIVLKLWWVYLPIVLGFGLIKLWKNYVEARFAAGLKWVVLELTPPPEVQKSPKIAENFFSGLHGVYAKPLKWKKKFFEGKAIDKFSLEIVGDNGDIRFYIRTVDTLRNLVETQIFAQWPEAEIKLVDDYVSALPKKLPDGEYDLFGADLIFNKENAYPIKTHPFFEEEGGKDEFVRTDPLAPLAELMAALKPGEHMWLQLIIRPTNDDWVKAAQPVIDSIVGRPKKKASENLLQKIIFGINNLLPINPAGEKKEEKKEEKEFNLQKLTPGQKFVLEQIENKVHKLGFECNYRIIYAAKRDIYDRNRISTVIGMFKQLYSNTLNTFKPDSKTMTGSADGWFKWFFPSDEGFFKKDQDLKRQKKIYKKYRERNLRDTFFVLNTEELATVYHLPGKNIKAPFFPRVDAKKGQPPAGLPMQVSPSPSPAAEDQSGAPENLPT